jgi:beta-galactosidase/beta-glucuronidase
MSSKSNSNEKGFKSLLQGEEKWDWAPKGDKIKTKWAAKLDPENIWPEYPRPQLERKEWLNLNGPWSFSIRETDFLKPEKPDGKILVPFSLESSLSGVMGAVNEAQIIWYEKEFILPENWKDKKILLHFGAVDWKCTLYINDAKIGEHEGGYSPFYFDITNRLNKEGKNKIVLRVYDPTNYGYQPGGKQTKNPRFNMVCTYFRNMANSLARASK